MHYAKIVRSVFFTCLIFTFSLTGYSQLTIVPAQPATVLANKLAGPGITILSPLLTCATVANGTFVSVATPLLLDSGIVLTTGKAVNTAGLESFLANTGNGTAGDPSLAALAGSTTYDACALEFDFIPNGDTISFNYQFGSEEYINSTCGPYNDAFAFFISGPGIVGAQNMALIPGTSIPVTVNSVNSGTPGGGYTLANCTAMGPGAPFTSYFYNNTGGTQLTYKGYTTKMRAFHDVTPCDTYHLKMAVCDAGNKLYDSGVFIEAGSLKTNSFRFNSADSIGKTINGLPHSIVKGCPPATFRIRSSHSSTLPQTVSITFSGSGISGTDFTAPSTATILPGDTLVWITVTGLPTPVGGDKTLTLFLLSPFSCGGIVDSVKLNILDSPSAYITTPDTTICLGASFQINATASTGLTYSWTPFTNLSSATVLQPIATPVATTTFSLAATLPNSGCPAINRSMTATVINSDVTITPPDTTICLGASVNLVANGGAGLNYSWSPASAVVDPTAASTMTTPLKSTIYTLSVTGTAGLCPKSVSVLITVANAVANLVTNDSSFCAGASIQMKVDGDPSLIYSWTPTLGLSDPTIQEPIASLNQPMTYVMTATVPGTPCFITQSVSFNIKSTHLSNVTTKQTIPYGSSIQLNADSAVYYMWTPNDGSLNNANINSPIATPLRPTTYVVSGLDLSGCRTLDSVVIDLYYNGEIFIPSAFTPDGDGRNDVFRIGNLGYNKVESFSVVNRWGNLVFHEADGGNKGWDGTYNNEPQDLGAYKYFILISKPDGSKQTFQGDVVLVR